MKKITSKNRSSYLPTGTHWGNYLVRPGPYGIEDIQFYDEDLDRSPISQSLLESQHKGARVRRPAIRKSFLEGSRVQGVNRGREEFVEVEWDVALGLVANEICCAVEDYGNSGIYAGSYGWSSAGRFHHAQSQIHRFFNSVGGYTGSVNTYSTAAAEVLVPYLLGAPFLRLVYEAPTIDEIIENAEVVLMFGGAASKNSQVNAGGVGSHTGITQMRKLSASDVRLICVSPFRKDLADCSEEDWVSCRPGTDVALMLGIAHELFSSGRYDREFIDEYCDGFELFSNYLIGKVDGRTKTADWASGISGVASSAIRSIATLLASKRSLITISWSLQRQIHGEQTHWMVLTLAAMLGQIGLRGRGIAFGLGCAHNIGFGGRTLPAFKVGSLPQGENLVECSIPVARIADMLLNPGQEISYDGKRLRFPEIGCIYWAGGNPFHHHQDLNRLRNAWSRPRTVIVHEIFWTSTARHADIVLPSTTSLERNDLGGSSYDSYLTPMHQALEPFGEARSDFDIFSDIAELLGAGPRYTENRTEMDWIEYLYNTTRENARRTDVVLPLFNQFWEGKRQLDMTATQEKREFTLEKFRRDPESFPLATPSGRIQLSSTVLEAFGYEEIGGHAQWIEREERLGGSLCKKFPFHLLSNQPADKLHSQYDFSKLSLKHKIGGRAAVEVNSLDASRLGLDSGDIVKIFNDRGACICGINVNDSVMCGVLVLPTGAWWESLDGADCPLDIHGNPNTLTPDVATSSLGQGPSANTCLVNIERYDGEPLPEVSVHKQPLFVEVSEVVDGLKAR